MCELRRFVTSIFFIPLLLLLISGLSCSKNSTKPPEPDRYLIAFESYRNGYNNIFVMNDDGTEQANLTTTLTDERQPEWTHNGKKIMYQAPYDLVGIQFLGVYMMDADGGHKTRYTGGAWHASQPDNPPNSELIVYKAVYQRQVNGDIHLVNFLMTDLQYLTETSADEHSPACSPIGPYIAFISDRDGNQELYIMNANGEHQRNLSLNPGNDGDFDWSPDGAKIAWVSERNSNMDIYTVTVEGGAIETRLTNYNGTDMDPNWSPDGSKIAFISTRGGSGAPNIFVMDSDGSNVIQLTEGSFNVSPQWSPDGRLIAFISQRDGNPEIYVMNADGSNQTRLTINPGIDGHIRWCPVPVDEM